jgi:hypothetical protein
MKSLAEKCILVNIRFGQWSGRIYDKKVSGEIEALHHASNAGKYNKSLIGEEHLKDIQSVVRAARGFLREQTLPWGDNNDRILLSAYYLEFLHQFGTFKSQFEKAVQVFLTQYPDLVKKAQFKLNGMYRSSDYPSLLQLKKKFNIDVACMNISEMEDFRVKINPKDAERLKQRIEEEYAARMAEATQDIWGRIAATVGHMAERLADPRNIFRDSLVDHVRRLIELLPKLNFNEDKRIKQIAFSMRSLLVDPAALRDDAHLRHEKAQQAQQILDQIGAYLPESAVA